MLGISIIGLGYWGPNYLRIFHELSGCTVRYCCDLDHESLNRIQELYPEVKVTDDYKEVAGDSGTDAVVIVTPPSTHYEIARCCMEHGKHVLVEKPFTSSSPEAAELVKVARENHLVSMVGHVYKHNPAIQVLRDYIAGGKLGKIYYLKAERIGLGPIRKQGSALWDLAVHDIYISLFLLGTLPIEVSARGGAYIQDNIEDFVNVSLLFPGQVYYTVYASWFAPEKVRKLTVVGSKAMAIFDDINKQEMLKIYQRELNKKLIDSTPDYHDHQNLINVGEVYLPKVPAGEPLKNQAQLFLDRIRSEEWSLSDAEEGGNVVRILEGTQRALKEGEGICLQKM